MRYVANIAGILTGVLGTGALFLRFDVVLQLRPIDHVAQLGNGPGQWGAAMIAGSLFLAVPILIWFVLQLMDKSAGRSRMELSIGYVLGGIAMIPVLIWTPLIILSVLVWNPFFALLYLIPCAIALLNIVLLLRNLVLKKNAAATCGIFLLGTYASVAMLAVSTAAFLTLNDSFWAFYKNFDSGAYLVFSSGLLAIFSVVATNTNPQPSEDHGRIKPAPTFVVSLLIAFSCLAFCFPDNIRLDRNLEQQIDNLGIESSVFIAEGTQLATTNQQGNVDLWETASGDHVTRFYAKGHMVRALLQGENDTIIGGDRAGVVWIWGQSMRRKRLGESPVGHLNSSGIALSPDKKALYWPGENLSVVATDLATGETLRTFENAFSDQAAWRYISTSGDLLATASGKLSDEKQVNLYNTRQGTLISSLPCYGPVVISSDQTFVACLTDDENLGVFELPSGKERFRTEFTNNKFILGIALSPNDQWVAIGAGDNHARVLDTETGEERLAFPHENFVDSVSFSPDSKLLATGSRSGYVRIFDLDTGEVVSGHGFIR